MKIGGKGIGQTQSHTREDELYLLYFLCYDTDLDVLTSSEENRTEENRTSTSRLERLNVMTTIANLP